MMDYDRLTRKVRVMVGGEEYSLLLTLGGLAELEDKMLKERWISIVTNKLIY